MKRSCVIPCRVRCKMNPGPLGPVGGLEAANFAVALQGERDFVETLQKAVAAARIDLEAMHLSRWRSDGLFFEIDRDAARALAMLDFHGKRVDNLLVNDDGQDADLKAIGEEDVAEPRTDDGANAHLLQRPHRAFA